MINSCSDHILCIGRSTSEDKCSYFATALPLLLLPFACSHGNKNKRRYNVHYVHYNLYVCVVRKRERRRRSELNWLEELTLYSNILSVIGKEI